MAGFTGAKRTREPSSRGDHDPAERIKDLDFEGVDVNLTLPSGWFGTWTAGEDVSLESAMYRAYHRWMNDYCGAYPERLGGIINVPRMHLFGLHVNGDRAFFVLLAVFFAVGGIGVLAIRRSSFGRRLAKGPR